MKMSVSHLLRPNFLDEISEQVSRQVSLFSKDITAATEKWTQAPQYTKMIHVALYVHDGAADKQMEDEFNKRTPSDGKPNIDFNDFRRELFSHGGYSCHADSCKTYDR